MNRFNDKVSHQHCSPSMRWARSTAFGWRYIGGSSGVQIFKNFGLLWRSAKFWISTRSAPNHFEVNFCQHQQSSFQWRKITYLQTFVDIHSWRGIFQSEAIRFAEDESEWRESNSPWRCGTLFPDNKRTDEKKIFFLLNPVLFFYNGSCSRTWVQVWILAWYWLRRKDGTWASSFNIQ